MKSYDVVAAIIKHEGKIQVEPLSHALMLVKENVAHVNPLFAFPAFPVYRLSAYMA